MKSTYVYLFQSKRKKNPALPPPQKTGTLNPSFLILEPEVDAIDQYIKSGLT